MDMDHGGARGFDKGCEEPAAGARDGTSGEVWMWCQPDESRGRDGLRVLLPLSVVVMVVLDVYVGVSVT